MINYKAFDVAVVGETIGWKSAAGYLEGRIVRIDRKKDTASPIHKSDWVSVLLDPYFARYDGETAYLNANFLRGVCRVVSAGFEEEVA